MNAQEILNKLDNVATNGDLAADMRRVHEQAATRLRAALTGGEPANSHLRTAHSRPQPTREERIAAAMDHARTVLESWA